MKNKMSTDKYSTYRLFVEMNHVFGHVHSIINHLLPFIMWRIFISRTFIQFFTFFYGTTQ